jgi:hypothetical protein
LTGALARRAIFQGVSVAQGGGGQPGFEVMHPADMLDRLCSDLSRGAAIDAVPDLDSIARIGRLYANLKNDVRARFDGASCNPLLGLNPNPHSLTLLLHKVTPPGGDLS